jgi:hypothetical protein
MPVLIYSQLSLQLGRTPSSTTSRSRDYPPIPTLRSPPDQALHIVHNFLAIYFPNWLPPLRMSAPQALPDALDTRTHLVDSVLVRYSA